VVFPLGVQRIERKDHGTQFPEPDLCNEKLRTVGQNERDRIALFNAQSCQCGGERVARPLEFRVGQPGTAKDCRCVTGSLRCGIADVVEQCVRWIGRERRRNALVVVREPGAYHF